MLEHNFNLFSYLHDFCIVLASLIGDDFWGTQECMSTKPRCSIRARYEGAQDAYFFRLNTDWRTYAPSK